MSLLSTYPTMGSPNFVKALHENMTFCHPLLVEIYLLWQKTRMTRNVVGDRFYNSMINRTIGDVETWWAFNFSLKVQASFYGERPVESPPNSCDL